MGKDPRAKKEFQLYEYPYPLTEAFIAVAEDPEAARDSKEAREAMIDPDETKEGHWLKLRIPRSKRDVDAVADLTAARVIIGSGDDDGAKLEQRLAYGNRGVFALLVEEWSFKEKFGMAANEASFADLDVWAADWVTSCVTDAVARGTTRDYGKKAQDSSNRPETSATEPSEPEPAVSA